jgi:hypothetical protein
MAGSHEDGLLDLGHKAVQVVANVPLVTRESVCVIVDVQFADIAVPVEHKHTFQMIAGAYPLSNVKMLAFCDRVYPLPQGINYGHALLGTYRRGSADDSVADQHVCGIVYERLNDRWHFIDCPIDPEPGSSGEFPLHNVVPHLYGSAQLSALCIEVTKKLDEYRKYIRKAQNFYLECLAKMPGSEDLTDAKLFYQTGYVLPDADAGGLLLHYDDLQTYLYLQKWVIASMKLFSTYHSKAITIETIAQTVADVQADSKADAQADSKADAQAGPKADSKADAQAGPKADAPQSKDLATELTEIVARLADVCARLK